MPTMNLLYSACAAGATKLVDYAQGYLPEMVTSYVRRTKVIEKLDPIGTLCMLTLRNFVPYDKAKPSMNGHFYWTPHQSKEGWYRFRDKVEHDDLGYLQEPLDELTTYWRPPKESTLVLIAKEAIKALEKTPTAYEGKTNCVKPTVNSYRDKLEKWIASLQEQPGATPVDTDFIKKIKGLWSDEPLNLFHKFYTAKQLPMAEQYLTTQREAYFRLLQPDGCAPFL